MKHSLKVVLVAFAALLPVGAVAVYGVMKKAANVADAGAPGDGTYVELDWRTLRGLNYETGEKPAELAALDGKNVKVPGFIVPLDDDAASFSEFLLVPSPQACIHVPPPPPNQMVMVRMKGDNPPQRSWGPVWIKGRLLIASTDSQYGKISYMLHADGSEPYRMPEDDAPPPPP